MTTMFKYPEQIGQRLCLPVLKFHEKALDWLSLSQMITSSSNKLCHNMEGKELCHDTQVVR